VLFHLSYSSALDCFCIWISRVFNDCMRVAHSMVDYIRHGVNCFIATAKTISGRKVGRWLSGIVRTLLNFTTEVDDTFWHRKSKISLDIPRKSHCNSWLYAAVNCGICPNLVFSRKSISVHPYLKIKTFQLIQLYLYLCK